MIPRLSTVTDVNDWRYRRKRSIPATVQGLAYPERIAMLREAFPRLPWVEAYSEPDRGRNWPADRHGGITESQVAELRSRGDSYGAMVLELKRELCLIRWRTWLDSKFHSYGHQRWCRPAQVAARAAKSAAKRAESRSPAGIAAGIDRRRRRVEAIERHAERRRRGVVWTEAPAMICFDLNGRGHHEKSDDQDDAGGVVEEGQNLDHALSSGA